MLEESCRQRYLSKLLENVEIENDDFDHLVQATDSYVGAYIEEVIQTLLMHALDAQDARLRDDPDAVEYEEPEMPWEEPKVPVTRQQIDAVLAEVRPNKKSRVEFRIA